MRPPALSSAWPRSGVMSAAVAMLERTRAVSEGGRRRRASAGTSLAAWSGTAGGGGRGVRAGVSGKIVRERKGGDGGGRRLLEHRRQQGNSEGRGTDRRAIL